MDPSLENILEQDSLRWVFVGGKGGVGKTTTSCSLAVQLSKVRKSVLLISTDPAHNLSDAFGQQFGDRPTLINGFPNLFAMEMDPAKSFSQMAEQAGQGQGAAAGGGLEELQSFIVDIPGADEAIYFAQVIKMVTDLDYSVIVFDTAPTGHTLRFLNFPNVLEKACARLFSLSGRFGPMVSQMASLLGLPASFDDILHKLEDLQKLISEVKRQFRDPGKTTFVCVCIAEFLSLYETERMVQELANFEIDTHNIVVNQLLFGQGACAHCDARKRIQQKYLDQISDLYEDFHVIKLPLLTREVRGGKMIEAFSSWLIRPYDPNHPDPVESK